MRQTLLLARDHLINRGLQAAMLHGGAGCHACQEQREPPNQGSHRGPDSQGGVQPVASCSLLPIPRFLDQTYS